jgi:hypothetical protein
MQIDRLLNSAPFYKEAVVRVEPGEGASKVALGCQVDEAARVFGCIEIELVGFTGAEPEYYDELQLIENDPNEPPSAYWWWDGSDEEDDDLGCDEEPEPRPKPEPEPGPGPESFFCRWSRVRATFRTVPNDLESRVRYYRVHVDIAD